MPAVRRGGPSKQITKDTLTVKAESKKEEEIKIALEKGAIAQKKMLAMIVREGRIQMKRTKPKQLTKKKTL